MVFLGFALVGLALAGVNAVHPRRPFVVLFLVYAVCCVGSFVTPGSPLGNNIGRFFMVFGLPLLLLLRHTRLRRPFRYGELAIIPIVLFALLQFGTATSHFLNAVERPQTTRAYFAPALAAARDLYDPNYRFHVVALRRHWEALYFPEAGYPITRGWYRQADAIHNGVFYTPLRRRRVRRLAAEHGRAVHLLAGRRASRPLEQTGGAVPRELAGVRPRGADGSLAHLPAGRREAAARPAAGDRGRGHGRRHLDRSPAHRLQRDAARHVLAQGHLVALLGARGGAGRRCGRGPTGSWTCGWTRPAPTRCAST